MWKNIHSKNSIYIFAVLLISFLLVCCYAGSTEDYFFYPEKKNLTFSPLPDHFTCADYRDKESWYKEMEWFRVSEDTDLELSLYTRQNDEEYVLWICFEGQIAQTDWDASIHEARFYRQDIDTDDEDEIIIIMTAGSAHWVREYIHVIDKNSCGGYLDISFPIEDYWKWVSKHIESDGSSTLSFLDSSVYLSAGHSLPPNGRLSKELYIFYGDVKNGKITASVEIDADWDEIPSPYVMGMLEADFVFDGEKFCVLDYRLKNNGD